jgi:hypothetical protein
MNCAIKEYDGVKAKLHTFLTSTLERDKWSGFMLRPHYPPGKNTHYTLDRRLGGSGSHLEAATDINIAVPTWSRTIFLDP